MGKAQVIKEYIQQKKIVVAPGAFDSYSAKLIEQAGFPAVYLTGYGAAANLLGAPDIGLLSMSEMVRHLEYMSEAVTVPIIADADTGYGNALNVWRTVKMYEKAGAAAIQLEDQIWPKRCGHMEGKNVIPADEMVAKLKAAVDARESADTLIIARTDAIAPYGFDEAIRRAHLYKEAGADIIFVEAPRDKETLAKIPQLVDAPVLANMIEGGKTPVLSAQELESMGFDVVIYPLSTLYVMARAVRDLLAELKAKGTTQGAVNRMISFADFNETVELSKIRANEKKYVG